MPGSCKPVSLAVRRGVGSVRRGRGQHRHRQRARQALRSACRFLIKLRQIFFSKLFLALGYKELAMALRQHQQQLVRVQWCVLKCKIVPKRPPPLLMGRILQGKRLEHLELHSERLTVPEMSNVWRLHVARKLQLFCRSDFAQKGTALVEAISRYERLPQRDLRNSSQGVPMPERRTVKLMAHCQVVVGATKP